MSCLWERGNTGSEGRRRGKKLLWLADEEEISCGGIIMNSVGACLSGLIRRRRFAPMTYVTSFHKSSAH